MPNFSSILFNSGLICCVFFSLLSPEGWLREILNVLEACMEEPVFTRFHEVPS